MFGRIVESTGLSPTAVFLILVAGVVVLVAGGLVWIVRRNPYSEIEAFERKRDALTGERGNGAATGAGASCKPTDFRSDYTHHWLPTQKRGVPSRPDDGAKSKRQDEDDGSIVAYTAAAFMMNNDYSGGGGSFDSSASSSSCDTSDSGSTGCENN